MDTSKASEDRSTPSKIKKIAAGVTTVVLIGAALYGVGRWQGYSNSLPQQAEIEMQVEEAQADVEAMQAQLEQTQQQLLVAQNYRYLMEARAALYHTAVDLEERNFGIANANVQEAANALGQVQAVEDYFDTEKISSLRELIAQTDLNVAVNLQQQRSLVLNFVTQLDDIVPDLPSEASASTEEES